MWFMLVVFFCGWGWGGGGWGGLVLGFSVVLPCSVFGGRCFDHFDALTLQLVFA